MKKIPVVSIMGKINSGKSTLFNRLVSKQKAIVSPIKSTTRDSNEGYCLHDGKIFKVVDAAGLIDAPATDLDNKINIDIDRCLKEADIIILLTDGKGSPTQEDQLISRAVRKSRKPVVLAVNKIDPGQDETLAYEYYSLGFGDPIPISALHGENINTLIDGIADKIYLPDETEVSSGSILRVGIVGRPNTGKTSLLNRLFGGEITAIVDDTEGTTRDFTAREIAIDNTRFLLIDTPGLQKGRKKKNLIDHINYKRTKKLLKHVDLTILLIDSTSRLTEGDMKIAYMIKESSCGCIIALNKWDIACEKEKLLDYWRETLSKKLQFLCWAPFATISAKTGQTVDKLKKLLTHTLNLYNLKINSDELSARWKEDFTRRIFSYRKRNIKFYEIKHIKDNPVVFKISTNYPGLIHFSMKRRIENWLRESHDFQGLPIQLKITK